MSNTEQSMNDHFDIEMMNEHFDEEFIESLFDEDMQRKLCTPGIFDDRVEAMADVFGEDPESDSVEQFYRPTPGSLEAQGFSVVERP